MDQEKELKAAFRHPDPEMLKRMDMLKRLELLRMMREIGLVRKKGAEGKRK